MNKNIDQKRQLNIHTVILLIAFMAACVVGGIFLYGADHGAQTTDVTTKKDWQNVVEIEGVRCIPRANLEVYLFIGVDERGDVQEVTEYNGTGQSDVLMVFVIDRVANTYALLPINRDTITDVRTLDEQGQVLATTKVQIALAHANGDGLEQSCENTVEAVSNLLYGQKIDGYVSLNMDAIRRLNHLVGGVSVTIEDDFSEADPSLKKGKMIKLSDEQAMHFVHDRMNVGDGTNEARMRRQNAYMKGLKDIMMHKTEKFAVDVFDGLQDYMVTSLTGNNVSRISKAILKNKDLGSFQIEGTNAIDSYGYNAFTVDRKSLATIVRTLFYDEVQ